FVALSAAPRIRPTIRENTMPYKRTIEKARGEKRAGKSASTQAGEFIREEIHKIRHGKHGARSPQQAIAIGLSEARGAGVDLPPPKRGKKSTRRSAKYAHDVGLGKRQAHRRPRVSRAVARVLQHEPRDAASHRALARHASQAATRRSPSARSASARKAARTKSAAARSKAAQKAARTRARRAR